MTAASVSRSREEDSIMMAGDRLVVPPEGAVTSASVLPVAPGAVGRPARTAPTRGRGSLEPWRAPERAHGRLARLAA
jgi:hypothetical protein